MSRYDNNTFMFDLIAFMEENGINVFDENGNYRKAEEVIMELVHESNKIAADVACIATEKIVCDKMRKLIDSIEVNSFNESETNNI